MRAIIIEEERFTEIREIMRFECEKIKNMNPGSEWRGAVQEVERTINFHFVRWAQSHGASCVRS